MTVTMTMACACPLVVWCAQQGVFTAGTASSAWFPLAEAVAQRHHDVVVWLLSLGADPNGHAVLWYGAYYSTGAILQLLVDAGGDVNQITWGEPLLFAEVRDNKQDYMRLLLAQPSLDLTVTGFCETPEQYAHRKPALAAMIAQEVSGRRPVVLGVMAAFLR